ncbi:glycosyltransferase family 2 protein [Hirschia baltica]|uniref:Glycosyl transferase family 2 n=1 Tax=Hirschia baltica (strain ATCC 49814 / DSM 5838 / IFAM 1418) TaxID=582402 RepID=C6XJG8_HIRBI|nr:glycosyltransferase family 2 protein [Hirschia baltica]ACT59263.1 glycosyl transferase family 2 [Hirschia baltica ATCC 49814]
MNKLPLSVFIIARDEADRILPVIRSVIDWVEEVFVIDSGSTDDTVEVSRNAGADVVFNEWAGYGPQKVFGETLCSQKWLLNIDADEEVSDSLRREITSMFEGGQEPPLAAYQIPILICFPFDKGPRPFAPSNDPIRLYNREKAGFKSELVHDSVVLKPNEVSGKLKHHINHRCFRSHHHAIEKINRYSSMQAEDMIKKGRKPSVLRLLTEPMTAFLKSMFLRRYVLFGVNGFTESVIYAFARFIRLAKAREAWKQHEANQSPRMHD